MSGYTWVDGDQKKAIGSNTTRRTGKVSNYSQKLQQNYHFVLQDSETQMARVRLNRLHLQQARVDNTFHTTTAINYHSCIRATHCCSQSSYLSLYLSTDSSCRADRQPAVHIEAVAGHVSRRGIGGEESNQALNRHKYETPCIQQVNLVGWRLKCGCM